MVAIRLQAATSSLSSLQCSSIAFFMMHACLDSSRERYMRACAACQERTREEWVNMYALLWCYACVDFDLFQLIIYYVVTCV